jgi:predicted metal-dependent RNase
MSDRTTRVNLENVAEVVINPATEAKQDDIIALISGGIVASSVLRAGRKTVTSAGTAETLVASTIPVREGVIVTALKTNTGNVFVGTSSVDSSSDKQFELEPGEGTSIAVNDLVNIYVDVAVNGEGVQYIGS